MKHIESISDLIKQLSNCNKEAIKGIIDRLKIPNSEFEKFATWDKTHYTRNCIARTQNFELLLLCWQAGQETPIHSHNDQDCWVFLIEGNITENQYKNNQHEVPVLTVSEIMQESCSYYINDVIGLHSLHNSEEKRAMSLHIYVNPIEECSYYSQRFQEYKIKKLCYDTVVPN
ncbi:MAG: cysteine dioxygenase family protein [Flavobacteriaceae bacterium]|nr:cysteine dioxygenase family protein [Flavobacteriaceae bacterium]